jgi:quercetin dioxygenase-like cupin family protein
LERSDITKGSMAFRDAALQAFTGLRVEVDVFTIITMRKSRVAGLVLLATAALAQQQQTVEITSEPSHHLVLENEYVRVFNVTVAPKATTLIHRHNHDYLFVTLGETDIINARVGEKPVALHLNDGEVRFTPGNFAHAAANESDRPFHNITIELLKPSSNVSPCLGGCATMASGQAASAVRLYSSDQWTVWLFTLPPLSRLEKHMHSMPHLVVPVSDLDLTEQSGFSSREIKRAPGETGWIPGGVTHTLINNSSRPAQFVTLDFKQEQPKP